MDNSVHVILTNWKRSQNLPTIVQAFECQTIAPARITICNNGPDQNAAHLHLCTEQALRDCRIWTFPDDGIGPTCRFAPGVFGVGRFKYTLFFDDDMAPGPGFIERLMADAAFLGDAFATIGGKGRRSRDSEYVARNVRQVASRPVAVDTTVRAHFVHTHRLTMVFQFISDVHSVAGRPTPEANWLGEDDILLCCAIQTYARLPSYLTRLADLDHRMEATRLAATDAFGAKPHHRELRGKLLGYAARAGWKSLWRQAEAHWESLANPAGN